MLPIEIKDKYGEKCLYINFGRNESNSTNFLEKIILDEYVEKFWGNF